VASSGAGTLYLLRGVALPESIYRWAETAKASDVFAVSRPASISGGPSIGAAVQIASSALWPQPAIARPNHRACCCDGGRKMTMRRHFCLEAWRPEGTGSLIIPPATDNGLTPPLSP
jgi:hypothetical protein